MEYDELSFSFQHNLPWVHIFLLPMLLCLDPIGKKINGRYDIIVNFSSDEFFN